MLCNIIHVLGICENVALRSPAWGSSVVGWPQLLPLEFIIALMLSHTTHGLPKEALKSVSPRHLFFCFFQHTNIQYCVCACSVVQLCPILCNPMDCSPPGSSSHGIFQARILERVAISYSTGYSRPRNRT